MKYADLLKKTPNELKKLESELLIDLIKNQAQAKTGGGTDLGKIKNIKKDLARIKMIGGKK